VSALEDTAQAVEEAAEAVLWDSTRDSIAHLIAAVRAHDAETVRSEGHHWSGEAGRALLHTADNLEPKETP
jgi:hypothetical protein